MREITAKDVFAAVADHLGAGDRPLEAIQASHSASGYKRSLG
jgi:hypothetical protein